MATNLALDQELLDHAFRVSGEPTKKAAVTRALQEFIARREQRRVAELFGTLEWDSAYDYLLPWLFSNLTAKTTSRPQRSATRAEGMAFRSEPSTPY